MCVVTVINGVVDFWPIKNDAVRFIETKCSWNFGDLTGYQSVLDQISSGRGICYDREYDLTTCLRAELAFRVGSKIGFFL